MDMKKAVHRLLVDREYKKNGGYWWKSFGHVHASMKLLKSRWGNQYFIDFGIMFNEIKKIEPAPEPFFCHVSGRIRSLLHESDGKFDCALDLDCVLTDVRRKELLAELLDDVFEKFLTSFSGSEEFRAIYNREGLLSRGVACSV